MKIESKFQKIEINSEQIKKNAWGYKDYSSCSIEDIDIEKKNKERNKIRNYILLVLLLLFIGQLNFYLFHNNTFQFSQFSKSSIKNLQVTVVFSSAQDPSRLRQCLQSFYTYNTYPIKKLIVAGSGKRNEQINKILSSYPEVVPLYPQENVGEVVVLDMIMKQVETEYYFATNTQFQFIKKGFIEKSLEVMELNLNLSSAALTIFDMDWGDNCSSLIDGIYCGFSFLPAMHRKSDYDNLPESYVVLTGNYSYGTFGGDAKYPIIYNYYLMGKRTFFFNEIFIQRIATQTPGKKGYRISLLQRDYDSLNATEKGEYTVAYSWSQMFKFYDEKAKTVNQQYNKGFVGKPISDYKIRGRAISQFGIDKQIQANTQFDYLNISKSYYYKNFVEEYSKLTVVQNPISIYSEYKSKEKLNQLLKNQLFSLICVTIKGSEEDFSSPRFESLLKSFSKQIYTDVTINIFSNQKSIPKIQQQINKTRLSEYVYSIFIYEDTHNYGSVGLSYVEKKTCPKNSLIINLNPTDRLLNSISLKYIKKAYENPNLMFATFKSKSSRKEQVDNLDESIIGEFRSKNEQDLTPFLKTYRQQMTYPNINSYLTQFVYNESSQSFHPKYYSSESEDFHAYTLIEMAGSDRVKFFDDIIIERQKPVYKQKCKSEKQEWTKIKAKLKTPIESIEQFYYPIKEIQGYKISNKIVSKLRTTAEKYQSCLKSSGL